MKTKILFKSNINHITKVRNCLNNSQKMNFTQVILSNENELKRIKAIENLNLAINLLSEIK
jgi:hypothetical protein